MRDVAFQGPRRYAPFHYEQAEVWPCRSPKHLLSDRTVALAENASAAGYRARSLNCACASPLDCSCWQSPLFNSEGSRCRCHGILKGI
jgi:hypothetical protein